MDVTGLDFSADGRSLLATTSDGFAAIHNMSKILEEKLTSAFPCPRQVKVPPRLELRLALQGLHTSVKHLALEYLCRLLIFPERSDAHKPVFTRP